MACANAGCRSLGLQIHNWVLKCGLGSSDSHVKTALIRFYLGSSVLEDARKVFDEITDVDVVQCTVLMTGYIQLGLAAEWKMYLFFWQRVELKGSLVKRDFTAAIRCFGDS